MHRFFVSPSSIQNQEFSTNDPELCHQLSKVLKMRRGEKIILCDNTEHEYGAELENVSKKECTAKILSKTNKPDISSERAIHLFVPPLKNPSRWEWMVEKCTEIGVASFTPLITERTEVKELRKIDRLERIIKEAAEQSGRTKLPFLHPPIRLSNCFTENRKPKTTNLIATLTPNAKPIRSTEAINRISTNLFIGPVGDFSPAEIQLALEHKFYPVTLGSQVLRTETAAIVASTLIFQS